MASRMSQIWMVFGTLLVCVASDITIPGHQRQITQTLRDLLGRWYYPVELGGIRSDPQAALCAAHSALALTTQDTWGYTMWDAHGKLPDGYGAGATEARGHAGLCRSVEAQFSGPLSAHLHRYREHLQSFNTSYQHLVRGIQAQRDTSFKGKYCLINIRSETQIEDNKPAVGGSSQLLSLLAEQYEHSYASCVPNSCTGLFLQESISNQPDTNGTVSVMCEGDHEVNKFTYGDYAFSILTIGLMTLVITAWTLEGLSPCDTKEHTVCPSCTPGRRMLRCFSPVENGKKLLSVGCSASGKDFKSLDGLRSISMIWVILAHRYMFFLLSVSNPQDILKHRNSWHYWWVFNAYPSVDTFLFISAFLLSVFLKNRVQKFSLTGFYLTRYFRLIPAMVYVMLGCMTVLKHLGEGLVWHRVYEGLFGSPCHKHAWANLFFINNLLDSNEMCMGHLWSLAAEWQLYLVTPLIVIPLYKWKNPVWKMVPLFCATALSIIIPAAVTILRNLPTTASFPDLMSSTVYYNSYYMVPWCRAGPYCIGIFAGWVYHWLNDTKPTIKKEYLVLGSIITSIISLTVLLGPSVLADRGVYWAALYTSLARPLWAVAIAFVVLCTCNGKPGIISWVCEWPIWGPVCRVSYCMFLVSLPLQSWASSRPQKMHYDSITAGYLVAGDLVLSYVVGAVVVLLIEAPAARMLNLVLLGKLHGKRSKQAIVEKIKNTEVMGETKQSDNNNNTIEQTKPKIEEEIPTPELLDSDKKDDDACSVNTQLDEQIVIKENQICRPRRKVGISGVPGRSENITLDNVQVNNVVRPEVSHCRPRRRAGVTEMPSLLTMIHALTDSANDSDLDRKQPEPLDTIREKLSIDSSPDATELAELIKKHSCSSSASLDDDDDEDFEIEEPRRKPSVVNITYNQDNLIAAETHVPHAGSLKRRHSLPVRRNSLPWNPLDFIGMSNCGGSTIRTRI